MTKQQLTDLAAQTHLSLDGVNADELARELSALIAFASAVQDAPTATAASCEAAQLREDLPEPSVPRQQLLRTAETACGGFYRAGSTGVPDDE